MPKRRYRHDHYHYTSKERREKEHREEKRKQKQTRMGLLIFAWFFIIGGGIYLLGLIGLYIYPIITKLPINTPNISEIIYPIIILIFGFVLKFISKNSS